MIKAQSAMNRGLALADIKAQPFYGISLKLYGPGAVDAGRPLPNALERSDGD